MLRVGIVAGEASGDLLAAGLMQAFRDRCGEDVVFECVAGPLMEAQGCLTLASAERLSVMGLIEPLARIPELFMLRRSLVRHFVDNLPDVFIGVDAPDFNLGLEYRLRQLGIKTVHYVSPSIWAWRQYRIKKIRKAVDLMLTLFPFEAEFYQDNDVPVAFVGHPLANMIAAQPDLLAARQRLGLAGHSQIIAMLPGSRVSEVNKLAPLMLETAAYCLKHNANLHFAVPLVNGKIRNRFEHFLQRCSTTLPITLFDGQARDVMEASDVVLVASGTATLEAMLLKKPMVVTYRLSALSYQIVKKLIKVNVVSLPNLLAGKPLVPELMQDEATPVALGEQLLKYLNDHQASQAIHDTFVVLHEQLRFNANEKAADRVLSLINS